MTGPAQGIHEHPSLKLGLRPPSGRPALMLRDVLTGAVPEHPAAADHLTSVQYGLYRNNEFGDCGPVSAANSRRMTTHYLAGAMHAPTQDDVFDLYRRSGNPGFDPATGADDNGVDMQTMLEAVHAGGIGGVRSVAFAKVDVSDGETMRAAVAIFGGLLYGLDLQVAQQAQTDRGIWDWAPSAAWGGHAVLGGRYQPGSVGGITWGRAVDMTDRFLAEQAAEAWVVIWPEHMGDRTFLAGVNVGKLRSAYRDLTGHALPGPEPTPAPGPAPDAPFLDTLPVAVVRRMDSRAARRRMTREEWAVWALTRAVGL